MEPARYTVDFKPVCKAFGAGILFLPINIGIGGICAYLQHH
ncbi:hypothetical protein P20652_0146 [Pseudoalteromonas sp. BSi20652]|nr:hypothetical protein P20652_0146 [Pseudoalteromonas sp. BSi20652]